MHFDDKKNLATASPDAENARVDLMKHSWQKQHWVTQVRLLAGFGLLSYLGTPFVLGASAHKTIFYIAVAFPCLLLIATDLVQIVHQDKKSAIKSFLLVISYFAISSLWSDDGQLLDGLKRAASLLCLMLAINSTMRLRPNAVVWIRRFIATAGALAVAYYCIALAGKIATTSDLSSLLTQRHSLRDIGGIGGGNPINGAIYMGVVTLAAWWEFPRSHPLAKLGLLALMACSTSLMFLSQSRGPFFALGTTLFLIALTRRHRDDLIAWCVLLAAGGVAITYLELLPTIAERLAAPNYRMEIWSRSVGLIIDNLYFGQGLGTSADIPVVDGPTSFVVSHSHSSMLEVFRVGGIIGGMAFLLMLYCNVRIRSSASDERRFFIFWLVFGVICLSTNGRLPIIRPSVEWFAFWVPMFLASLAPGATTTHPVAPEQLQKTAP